jgi:hypothetical protein
VARSSDGAGADGADEQADEITRLRAKIAAFDHDGDGKPGGSPKGGLRRKKDS